MLFSYHLLYFCTALSLIIMLSSHYHHHKSKTFSQLTQCPFTGTLLLFNLLISDQKSQLSTPCYQLKKDKRDSKKTATPGKHTSTSSVTLSPTLVDLAHVSVVGLVDGQGTVRSPDLSAQPAEKKKVEDKKSSSKSVKSDKSTKSSSTASSSRPATVSTDHRIDELDQEWSDRFNRLEALLMARILDRPQEPTFSFVKVALIIIIIIIMYLYSAQYLHIQQDSKRYLTNPTVQVQSQLTSN